MKKDIIVEPHVIQDICENGIGRKLTSKELDNLCTYFFELNNTYQLLSIAIIDGAKEIIEK